MHINGSMRRLASKSLIKGLRQYGNCNVTLKLSTNGECIASEEAITRIIFTSLNVATEILNGSITMVKVHHALVVTDCDAIGLVFSCTVRVHISFP